MAISNPTPANATSVHLDGPLSDFATAYENRAMIADILCPIVKVDKRSDEYHKRSRRGTAHLVADLMGPKSRANESTYETTSDNYSVKDRGQMDYISRALELNADGALSPREETVSDLMTKLALTREARVASLFCTSGNYASGNTAAAGTVWTNKSTSTPMEDILTARGALPPGGPNSKLVAFCALEVWNALRVHPDLLSLKGMEKGMISTSDFASFFGVDDLLVSDAEKDTANMGQSAVYSRIFTATVFGLARVPLAPSKRTSAFGLTFRVNPGIQVTTWDEPSVGVQGSEGIRVAFSDDENVIQNDMAYLITGVR